MRFLSKRGTYKSVNFFFSLAMEVFNPFLGLLFPSLCLFFGSRMMPQHLSPPPSPAARPFFDFFEFHWVLFPFPLGQFWPFSRSAALRVGRLFPSAVAVRTFPFFGGLSNFSWSQHRFKLLADGKIFPTFSD